MRTDLSLHAQVYVLSAILMGFFLVEPLMPEEYILSDEEMAGLIAETVHRALESGRAVSANEHQAISQAFRQYLNGTLEIDQEQFRQALDS